MSQSGKLSVAFVVPCLNEQRSLGQVLGKINSLCEGRFADRPTEVIVADNGSTDESTKIAARYGAKVVHCRQRGYGAALKAGIGAAGCEAVVFADADGTYDFLEAPRLVDRLEQGYDLVVGSRLAGEIHRGAMPFLHRHLGTPVLNFFLNLLYARGGAKVGDCNSGFRCLRRRSFEAWGIRSTGMEFASEMLVKALKHGARICEVPVSLYPDAGGRAPHLQRWRDGMRHLLQIFLDCPGFFFAAGTAVFAASWVVVLSGLFAGPVKLGAVWVLGLHSMMFGLLGSLFGIIIWSVGLFLAVRVETSIGMYRRLLGLGEDKLFWYGTALGAVSAAFLAAIVVLWGLRGFRDIYLERQTLTLVTFASDGMLLVSNVVTAHLLKRS